MTRDCRQVAATVREWERRMWRGWWRCCPFGPWFLWLSRRSSAWIETHQVESWLEWSLCQGYALVPVGTSSVASASSSWCIVKIFGWEGEFRTGYALEISAGKQWSVRRLRRWWELGIDKVALAPESRRLNDNGILVQFSWLESGSSWLCDPPIDGIEDFDKELEETSLGKSTSIGNLGKRWENWLLEGKDEGKCIKQETER